MAAPGEPQSPHTGNEHTATPRPYGGEVNTLVDIYSKHERRIYRYCLALLRNPDDAEDATQETFTRAAPFLPNLAGDLSAYLTTVARNICCDVVRARARRPVPLDNVTLPDRAVSPERQSVDWDVVRRMWRQLSPSERLLFAYTFAGYRYEEIATRTGMSRPSVSVGLTRARRRLRDLASAIGALGLLPLGLRRLLDRASRRVQAATAGGQQVLLTAAEQVGAITATVLAGLMGWGAAAQVPALAYAPPAATGIRAAVADSTATVARTSADNPAVPALAAARPAKHQRQQAPAPAPNPVIAALPNSSATPDDATPRAVTASPGFTQDGTAFVIGDVTSGCTNGAVCPAAFRTDDAGASWHRVWQATYPGGYILLSPRFPADPAVFVLNEGGAGLMVSPSGDGTFSTAVPDAAAATVAPDSTVGHARLVAASGSMLMSYTVGDAAPRPGPALPPGMTATSIAFTAPDHVVVVGWQVDPAAPNLSLQRTVVVSCSLTLTCGTPLIMEQYPFMQLAPTPGFESPLVLYALGGDALISTDHGATFAPLITTKSGRLLRTVELADVGTATRIVVGFTSAPSMNTVEVLYTDDLGATFKDASGDLQVHSYAVDARPLQNGNLLVTVEADAAHRFALEESTGNGDWAAASSF